MRRVISVGCGGHWWHIGRVDAFRLEGRGSESRSSRHVGTLGKSFTVSIAVVGSSSERLML